MISLVRKYLYLHHRYLVGLAFIPLHRTLGSMPGGRVRGQNLVHSQKMGILRLSFLEVHILITTCQKVFRKHSYLHHRYLVGLAFIPTYRTPGSMPGGEARGPSFSPASCPVHITYIESSIFFEAGMPNLVCGCIYGWGSVAYAFLGHYDLEL